MTAIAVPANPGSSGFARRPRWAWSWSSVTSANADRLSLIERSISHSPALAAPTRGLTIRLRALRLRDLRLSALRSPEGPPREHPARLGIYAVLEARDVVGHCRDGLGAARRDLGDERRPHRRLDRRLIGQGG